MRSISFQKKVSSYDLRLQRCGRIAGSGEIIIRRCRTFQLLCKDWDIYGFDRDTDESREGAANLLGVMGGVELTPEMIKDGSYIEKLKPISAVMGKLRR